MTHDAQAASQSVYDVRFDWGAAGIKALAGDTAAFVIVDVLSFSTCVDVAVSAGADVYPCRFRDPSAQEFADRIGALCAGRRSDPQTRHSLSPGSLIGLASGTRLVLPSPNGATLSLATGDVPTYAACLRNGGAVAAAMSAMAGPVTVIAAGEKWPDGSLRPALEDLVGAGAVVANLSGNPSPEARLAKAAFQSALDHGVTATLADSVSGRELAAVGFAGDVEIASQVDISDTVPCLRNGAYCDG